MDAVTTIGIAVPHELEDDAGVGHVVEHLVAHGPRRRGGRYLLPGMVDTGVLRSFTGLTFRSFTGYVATCRRSDMAMVADVLHDALADPVLDAGPFLVERGRPASEGWRLGTVEDELAVRASWFRDEVTGALAALFAGTPLRHDPGGLPGPLRALDHDRLLAFHRRWYRSAAFVHATVDGDVPWSSGADGATFAAGGPAPVIDVRPASVGAPCPASVVAWRMPGAAPRAVALVAARALARLLNSGPVRASLRRAGTVPVAGPVVDASTPQPAVVGVWAGPAVATAVRDALASSWADGAVAAPLFSAVTRAGRAEPLAGADTATNGMLALLAHLVATGGRDARAPVAAADVAAVLAAVIGTDTGVGADSDAHVGLADLFRTPPPGLAFPHAAASVAHGAATVISCPARTGRWASVRVYGAAGAGRTTSTVTSGVRCFTAGAGALIEDIAAELVTGGGQSRPAAAEMVAAALVSPAAAVELAVLGYVVDGVPREAPVVPPADDCSPPVIVLVGAWDGPDVDGLVQAANAAVAGHPSTTGRPTTRVTVVPVSAGDGHGGTDAVFELTRGPGVRCGAHPSLVAAVTVPEAWWPHVAAQCRAAVRDLGLYAVACAHIGEWGVGTVTVVSTRADHALAHAVHAAVLASAIDVAALAEHLPVLEPWPDLPVAADLLQRRHSGGEPMPAPGSVPLVRTLLVPAQAA